MEMSGYQYNCAGGETFDSIALEVYEDEKYAAELMCCNPEYTDISVFGGGEALLLPIIDNSADEEEAPATAPWKE